MRTADDDTVLRLWQRTEGVGLNESDTRAAIKAYLARNPGGSFVARAGGEIVGAVLCGHDGRRGYLHHLAVEKTRCGRGWGRCLVRTCLTQLRRLGIPKCNIFLFAGNAAGGSFWEHDGWRDRRDLRVMQEVIGQPE